MFPPAGLYRPSSPTSDSIPAQFPPRSSLEHCQPTDLPHARKERDSDSLDVEDLSSGDDVDSLLGGDGVGDLTSELSGVHHEEVDLSGVVDEHDLVAGGDHVSGKVVGSVTGLMERGR
jgi:hypothetical protein